MKTVNFKMLGFAVATVICFILTGIAVGERSIFGIILSLLGVVFIMGFGFMTKKKLREQGKL